jgi:fatty-acyl-CoA synthase
MADGPVAGRVERRRSLLEERHRPWRPRTLPALLDDVAAGVPDRPFVIDEQGSHTYAQLAEWSRGLARGLLEHGVGPGDHVAMLLPNSAETVAVRFAVARVGAVAVPVNPLLHAEELGYVLRQSKASVLVTAEEHRGGDLLAVLDEAAPGWESGAGADPSGPDLRLVVTVPRAASAPRRPGRLTLATLARDEDGPLDARLREVARASAPEDTATIFYTSGTTGQPKGVLSTHDMELRSAYGSAYTRAFEDGRRIYFSLPLHHVFAYVEGLLASLFVGGCVVVGAVFDPKAALDAIERHRAGEALFVPTMSLAVVEAARRSSYDLESLHSVMSAASSAPERLWTDLRDELGLEQLVTAYGMTETSAATTFTMPGDPVDDLVGTVGRPKPGGAAGDLVEYKTVGIDGSDLPAGAEGELVARGAIVAEGYFEKPEETAAVSLPGGWLRSGDLGLVRDDGYLVLTGRAKDLYKCGGELVMPTEVEHRLTRLDSVAQAYVVGVPDERMGEVGCAWVVPAEGAAPTEHDLVEHCRRELARFKVPAHVLFTTAERLPLTASGKVQKFKLAERAVVALGRAAPVRGPGPVSPAGG